ncbi:Branched-chain amino acid transport system permease protein LivM [Nitrincola lacisaponensis]|uniref:Branched-chain amino acid transport system permease protein LivM n=1 Tax=Nitrincola lacisaponensis TaxID=267850 RepID=A0A063XZU7_9GAMM|nr:branched-chain amino acid ABC transporter permease [Nitrincola lacisaponensis]KDE38959.1 Branched-chain amino acid transport system permease protein LivM [Nitrincola lacisaponensis]
MLMKLPMKETLLMVALAVAVLLLIQVMGTAYGVRVLVEASCYAIIALGLTIQWGYAGLFNAGIMGFVALGGFSAMLLTFPVNQSFWESELSGELGMAFLKLFAAIALVAAVLQLHRLSVPRSIRVPIILMVLATLYLWVVNGFAPVSQSIVSQYGFIGGFGLPVWAGWLVGGVLAGGVAYFIGHICLGLRSDYLAIATLGVAEIIKAFLKNSDWLTRGTLTVSPLPWPVPGAGEVGFVMARSLYLSVTAVLIAIIFYLLHRAYNGPWGRMMRAIRDNELSSSAMGKDVNQRRLEVFILGCVLMGIGGAALATFNGIFDPNGYLPLNHTFLVWVMVILGGPGNNLGTLFGAVFVYVIWVMSEPVALFILNSISYLGDLWFAWEAPSDFTSRALQARVFTIGLIITLVLRYAPNGLFPEKVQHHH